MYNRKKMPSRKDKKVFANTAVRGKAANVNHRVARGGIRL